MLGKVKNLMKRLWPLPTRWAVHQHDALLARLESIEQQLQDFNDASKKQFEILEDLRRQGETNAQLTEKQFQNFSDSSKKQFVFLESIVDEIYDAVVKEKKVCPICQCEVRAFQPFEIDGVCRKNAHCLNCRCAERQRALWLYFMKHTNYFSEEMQTPIKLLHFAPEKGLRDLFSSKPNIDYYPVDINPSRKGIRDVVDIQNIQYDDNSFDIIVCNHVLEHVPDDYRAMRELLRVLKKPGGGAYITSPVFENFKKTRNFKPEYNTPELRRKYYGQHDHLRKYGMDFPQRLIKGGFAVEILKPGEIFTKDEMLRYCIKDNAYDTIYKCTNPENMVANDDSSKKGRVANA